jgi:hypothetical protein
MKFAINARRGTSCDWECSRKSPAGNAGRRGISMDGKDLSEKLKFALELIEEAQKEADGSANELFLALSVMEFGHISIQDMMKHLEANGYGRN